MKDKVNRFYSSITNVRQTPQNELIDLFLYFLTVEEDQPSAAPKQIIECFTLCPLQFTITYIRASDLGTI